MRSSAYAMAPMPSLHVGINKLNLLPELIKGFGNKILLVTGARSFRDSAAYPKLLAQLSENKITIQEYNVEGEPSPEAVDRGVESSLSNRPDVVIGIGGGSVLDAAKAISAMLPLNQPVKTYLEGVGTGPPHPGTKVPFIAIPTTSGTGSETTRNAVLSEVSVQGYKRSLRHTNFVSNATILDPQLMIGCPANVTAYSGMDAFTQLLESYLSTGANPMTDMLAIEGLRHVATSMKQAYDDGSQVEARLGMALAAYLSGVTLTNAGLGLIHGLAGVIGGFRKIPHGVICSALMAASNKLTLQKLYDKASWHPAIAKYATVGKFFTKISGKSDAYYADQLIETIVSMTSAMKIPSLGAFGISTTDILQFAAVADNKNNPVPLSREEIIEVLELSSK